MAGVRVVGLGIMGSDYAKNLIPRRVGVANDVRDTLNRRGSIEDVESADATYGRRNYEPPTVCMKMFEQDLSVIGADLRRLGIQTPLFDKKARRMPPETHDATAVFEVYGKRAT